MGVITFEVEGLWISAIADEENLVLVDCGYPGYTDQILEGLRAAGADPAKLSHIIITHHDEDHLGSLRDLEERFPKAVILATEESKPYILGEKKYIRLAQAEAAGTAQMSEDDAAYWELVRSIRPAQHVETVRDGDVLPVCGGIEIVETPGHLPGHLSVYVRRDHILIPGDALSNAGGELIVDPTYALDLPLAVESAKNLMKYEIEEVRCYHGGTYKGNVREALASLK